MTCFKMYIVVWYEKGSVIQCIIEEIFPKTGTKVYNVSNVTFPEPHIMTRAAK